jgi:electron transfer flavoprotein alpha subunit
LKKKHLSKRLSENGFVASRAASYTANRVMKRTVVIIAEHNEGRAIPMTYELVTLAHKIGEACSLELKVVVLGAEVETISGEIATTTGIDVVAVRNTSLATYNAELYKNLLTEILSLMEPNFVLAPQTTRGIDFAPGLAVRLKAGCITGVNAMGGKEGKIYFSRSAYNGKIVSDLLPLGKTTVLIVEPGAFKPHPKISSFPGNVDLRISTAEPEKTKSLGIKSAEREDSGLAEADVIVAAGRGIGERKNLILIERLAGLFPRSAVAGSRPICDQGWMAYKSQVGLTGTTVSPRLYIACGISGAIQHTVGMQGAGFIVAISTDPNAAIFNMADVCIVEDLISFIPTFLEVYQEKAK